jgi:16S rRNA processing protein RimM
MARRARPKDAAASRPRNIGGDGETARSPTASRLIAVGVFGAPQGVRGEVRIKAHTTDPDALGAYGPLSDAAGTKVFKIVALRRLKREMVVARIEGVSDRDAAKKLEGVELFARRENLPAIAEDEFYHADLVGLEAVSFAGQAIGRIVALRNFGAGDILEIAPAAGGETRFLPFTKRVAPLIDIAGRRIVIVPPREIEGEARRDEG